MENQEFENRVDLSKLKESIEKIRQEVGKVIVGQHKMVDLMMTALLSDGHILLEGVPGVAKTLSARVLSKVIKTDFSRIQFTPDLMPSDVLGTSVYNMKTSDFEFNKGPIFSNIVLIDEINRAPAKTQAALFEVMEEHQVTIDGTTYTMEEPFMVMATQNPIEHEGTYRLPEAQLDRFLFKINVDYPTESQELEVLKIHHGKKAGDRLPDINPVITPAEIKQYRETIQNIFLEEHLFNYIVQIVRATREDPSLYLGGSPRATVAILNGSKAFAALQGRDFVTPEDIQFMAVPVLRHRVILSPEREMEGLTSDEIIDQLLKRIEVPR
ncbi:MAG: MoxR family ATPase [Cyclobacteriaceae bacterium]|nr:MoxR family ATPase [Cyclobacteriaceae bacterium]